MKCISCEIEINPKWKHAIDINVCPFCGQHIMEEHLKNLLASLAETMEKLQAYPEQVNDWLLSNYNYIKTDSPNLKQFLPKEAVKELKRELDEQEFQEKKTKIVKLKNPQTGEVEEVVVEKTMSDDKASGFFERAEALRPSEKGKKDGPKSVAEKTRNLKKLKEQIETEGAKAVVTETGLAAMISPEDLENANPEDVAAYQSLLSENDVASGLPPAIDDEDGMADQVLQMNLMAAKGKKNQGGGYNEQDARALIDMQQRVRNSRKNFESGENRGGKGGGFSRST